jgi:hypothetical protein
MEVSGQLNAMAALTPVKSPWVRIGQKAGWNPEGSLDAVEKRKILFLLRIKL